MSSVGEIVQGKRSRMPSQRFSSDDTQSYSSQKAAQVTTDSSDGMLHAASFKFVKAFRSLNANWTKSRRLEDEDPCMEMMGRDLDIGAGRTAEAQRCERVGDFRHRMSFSACRRSAWTNVPLLMVSICSMVPLANAFSVGVHTGTVGLSASRPGIGVRLAGRQMLPGSFVASGSLTNRELMRKGTLACAATMCGGGFPLLHALHTIGLSLPTTWFKMLVSILGPFAHLSV